MVEKLLIEYENLLLRERRLKDEKNKVINDIKSLLINEKLNEKTIIINDNIIHKCKFYNSIRRSVDVDLLCPECYKKIIETEITSFRITKKKKKHKQTIPMNLPNIPIGE